MMQQRNFKKNETDQVTKALAAMKKQSNELYFSLNGNKPKSEATKGVFEIVKSINSIQSYANNNVKKLLDDIRSSCNEVLAATMKDRLDYAELSAERLMLDCDRAITVNNQSKN